MDRDTLTREKGNMAVTYTANLVAGLGMYLFNPGTKCTAYYIFHKRMGSKVLLISVL